MMQPFPWVLVKRKVDAGDCIERKNVSFCAGGRQLALLGYQAAS
jgi:hypothetical protein